MSAQNNAGDLRVRIRVMAAVMTLAGAMALATVAAADGNMKRVEIIDTHSFKQPMQAESLMIPADWKFEGSVQWHTRYRGWSTDNGIPDPADEGVYEDCGFRPFDLDDTFRASSPDGRTVIEKAAGTDWQWSDNPQRRQAMAAENRQNAKFYHMVCDIRPVCGELLISPESAIRHTQAMLLRFGEALKVSHCVKTNDPRLQVPPSSTPRN